MRVHSSEAVTANSKLRVLARRRGEGNAAWLERALGGNDDSVGDCSIVLLGGAGLTDFRLRVAQSGARSDLLPSYWSHIAILADRKQLALHEVSLEPPGGFGNVASTQGIRSGRFRVYDDPAVFPNVAIVHWKLKSPPGDISPRLAIDRVVARLSMDRGSIDILTPLWTWLGFVWGVGDHDNPLPKGVGIPSAVLVESVFARRGIELTPGLTSQSSCPEAVWQAAKWWAPYYDSAATITAGPPWGSFVVDQPAAAVTVEDGRASRKPTRKRTRKASS